MRKANDRENQNLEEEESGMDDSTGSNKRKSMFKKFLTHSKGQKTATSTFQI